MSWGLWWQRIQVILAQKTLKVKEMVGNRGEEAFRVELQLKDGQ